jgi:hypothetical protein
MRQLQLLILAAGLAGVLSTQAQSPPASLPILYPYITSADGNAVELGGASVGSYFTVSSPVTVEYAGIWDYNAAVLDNTSAGLAQNHLIDLWEDDSGTYTLLATATTSSGTVDPLVYGFRWVDLNNSVTLTAGNTYLLDAYYAPSSPDRIAQVTHTTDSPYIWNYDADSNPTGFGSATPSQGGIADPNTTPFSTDGTQGYFSADLATSVPEPSSLSLLCLGVLALAGRMRRK